MTAANDAKVPVSTIAFGTQTGTVVVEGQRIAVPVDRPALRSLADSTGGKAYTAESSSDLVGAYKDIGSSVGTTKEKREVTDRLTGLGLLLAAGAGVLGLVWGTRIP